jgi:hypothetical protein
VDITQAVAVAVLMVLVPTQQHKEVLPTSAVQVVLVAGHTVFVEATAVAVKAHKAMELQEVSLSDLERL